jgi:hypothetical protein
MSTKTSFKRIALVAVTAMGFGLLSSVAPASAANTERDATSITVGAYSPARVGVTSSIPVTFALPSATVATDTTIIVAKLTSAPTGSNMLNTVIGNNLANDTAQRLGWATNSVVADSTYTSTDLADVLLASGLYTMNSYGNLASAADADDNLTANLSFTPDVAGTYTILVSNGNTAYTAGDAATTITITTTGVASSVTLSTVASTTPEGTTGTVVKVVAKDAAGNVTVPGADEAFVVTTNGTATISDTNLSGTDFSTYGAAFFNVYLSSVSADTVNVITVTGSAGISSSVVGTISITIANVTSATPAASIDLEETDGYAAATTSETADNEYETASTSHSFELTFAAAPSATAATYYGVVFSDTDGKITGKIGASIAKVITVAAAGTTGTTSVTADLAGLSTNTFLVTATGASGTNDTVAIAGGTATADEFTADQTIVRAAVAGTVTLTGTLTDTFAAAMANQTVTVAVTGRNATTSSISKSTDADGRVTFSLTDTGTTGTSSVVTFTHGTVAAATDYVTIYWGEVAVDTVTVTGGATANTVAYPAVGSTTKAISTAVGGASGSATTFTALVKDAAGNVLSGVPVTWTVDSATAGITKSLTSDSASCYTGSDGKCTTTVFSWAAPSKVTVTATAGGKTGTGYENFVNAATDARVLSATVSGSLAVAKVVDRYGNAVAGVTVSAKTSNGYFGSGATSTTGVTTTDGTVGFALTGAGTVTLSVDSATYTQTDDAAGKVGTTAVTAAVAGTTTGTGASLSPAGVNSVSVEITEGTNSASQAAADAAAEATDAANAATDAANAAAEAADAATAAAQDAADAVAALSAQVATLISGLKAQLTALTNLVIKIQKKVKA